MTASMWSPVRWRFRWRDRPVGGAAQFPHHSAATCAAAREPAAQAGDAARMGEEIPRSKWRTCSTRCRTWCPATRSTARAYIPGEPRPPASPATMATRPLTRKSFRHCPACPAWQVVRPPVSARRPHRYPRANRRHAMVSRCSDAQDVFTPHWKVAGLHTVREVVDSQVPVHAACAACAPTYRDWKTPSQQST